MPVTSRSASRATSASAFGPCTARSAVSSLTFAHWARPSLCEVTHAQSFSMLEAFTTSMK